MRRVVHLAFPLLIVAWGNHAVAQTQQAELSSSVPTQSEGYATSTSVWGRVAAVGAPFHSTPAVNAGKVFLYEPDSQGGWVPDGTIQAPSPSAGALFGFSLATDGYRLVVGAPQSSPGGEVHVFKRDAGGWVWEASIAAPPAALGEFGYSIDISGNRIAVGSPSASAPQGRVSIFERSGTTWSLLVTLAPFPGVERYGASVDLDGGRCIAGAPNTWVGGLGFAGLAIVSKQLSGSSWFQEDVLYQSTPNSGAEFGFSVALEGPRALVGCPRAVDTLTTQLGRAYAFELSGGNWVQTQELLDTSGIDDFDHFGTQVKIVGRNAVVGARLADFSSSLPDSGSAFLYELTPTGWGFVSKFASTNVASFDRFGESVGLSTSHIIVGAIQAQNVTGRAYVFGY